MKLKLHLPISGIRMSRLFAGAQNLGKSFMLPIAILPAAGLLLGFGGVFTNPVTLSTYPFLNGEVVKGDDIASTEAIKALLDKAIEKKKQ